MVIPPGPGLSEARRAAGEVVLKLRAIILSLIVPSGVIVCSESFTS